MLESINLSLSSVCGGDCLFCPDNRGKRIEQKIMSFECVEKIIDEISSKEFKKNHNIMSISVGENGDAFLNKDFIRILRLIKFKLPLVKITIATNFQNFTEEWAEIILKEKLIDVFYSNIDGSNEKNYFNMKKMNFNNSRNNLIDFLKIRKKLNFYPPLNISVVTLNRYIRTIYYNFGFYPVKLKDYRLIDIPDDFLIIKKQLEEMLMPGIDRINKTSIFGWAEREQVDISKIDYKKYSCNNLHRVEMEAFIAPNGVWYICCFDADNELILGNVAEQSINEIFFSPKRQKLLNLLKNQQFSEIGGPCKTVNCCQYLSESKLEKITIEAKKTIKKIKRFFYEQRKGFF